MKPDKMRIVFCGLSITSSWGNAHATTYRSLIRQLDENGHNVLFLERESSANAENRDLPHPPYCDLGLYSSLEELKDRFTKEIELADVVIVGSYVQEGVEIGKFVTQTAKGVTAFYDIDTPITLARLGKDENSYLSGDLIREYDLYLSFSGGPILRTIENRYGSPKARPLYCSVDPADYYIEDRDKHWDLGYLGTYSNDRQHTLNEFLIHAANQWQEGRFIVAGARYPQQIQWPDNVKRFGHLMPKEHRAFYNEQRFTLNVTRRDMIRAGYSPSVRLFEAAACGTPLISDHWPGLDTIFHPGTEVLIAKDTRQVLSILRELPERKGRRSELKREIEFSVNIPQPIEPMSLRTICKKHETKKRKSNISTKDFFRINPIIQTDIKIQSFIRLRSYKNEARSHYRRSWISRFTPM